MGSRPQLQTLLEGLLGSRNVYYNPPGGTVMKYPAIKYALYDVNTSHADDVLYRSTVCYSITIINALPNDNMVEKILKLPMCSFDRHYTYDGLNHDVVRLYY